MEIRIDPNLTNGLVQEGTGGTVVVSPEGLVTLTAVTSEVRRTRWVSIKPGETIVVSVEMCGSPNLRLYTSTAIGQETLVGTVTGDSGYDMKKWQISYTLPINSAATMIGVAFAVPSGIGKFYRPIIDLINKVDVAPALIACGLIAMDLATVNADFPSFGIASTTLLNNIVTVTLSALFGSSATRPIPIAVDGSATPHPNKLICNGVTFNNGIVTFRILYVNASGVIVPPPAISYAQVAVYH